ncbi:MAG TPA: TilS substrate-binding domain-containing protein, partial [Acidimicrobiales bacterium]|nr:TilS substrate-binding domain-containing protein [Acidimicrobiales bacterium]
VALCAEEGLSPVDDPSNRDPRFLRNRIRAELLPLCSELAGRDLVPVLVRQAGLLAGDAEVLQVVAELVDPADARAVADAPDAVARRAVRAWLAGDSRYPPSLDAVDRVLEVARGASKATEVDGGVRVARSKGRLSRAPVTPRPPAPPSRPQSPPRSPAGSAGDRPDTVGP